VQIRTVKYSREKGTVEVLFTRPNGKDQETVQLQSSDLPGKAFVKAFKALDGDFRYVMHQPEDNDVEVSGIHFKESGGRDTFQLLGGIRVEAGFSSLNSPKLYEPGGDLFEGACLTDAQAKRFLAVARHAKKYVEGSRTAPVDVEVEEEAAAE